MPPPFLGAHVPTTLRGRREQRPHLRRLPGGESRISRGAPRLDPRVQTAPATDQGARTAGCDCQQTAMLTIAAILLWLYVRALDEPGARYGVGVPAIGVAGAPTAFPAKYSSTIWLTSPGLAFVAKWPVPGMITSVASGISSVIVRGWSGVMNSSFSPSRIRTGTVMLFRSASLKFGATLDSASSTPSSSSKRCGCGDSRR